jgi:hypothetical protein
LKNTNKFSDKIKLKIFIKVFNELIKNENEKKVSKLIDILEFCIYKNITNLKYS